MRDHPGLRQLPEAVARRQLLVLALQGLVLVLQRVEVGAVAVGFKARVGGRDFYAQQQVAARPLLGAEPQYAGHRLVARVAAPGAQVR